MMTSILIATPMHNAECSGLYTKSLLQSFNYLIRQGYEVGYETVMHDALLTRSRNTLVHAMMKHDFDYILFIDADIAFNGVDIEKMILADKDVVAGAFPKKTVEEEYAISPNNLKIIDDLVECDYVGTGIILIKRNVFEKMSKIVDTYINTDKYFSWMNVGEIIYNYFDTSIYNNQYMPESYNFCRQWRQLGGKIYILPDMNIGHIGSFNFERNFSKSEQFLKIEKE